MTLVGTMGIVVEVSWQTLIREKSMRPGIFLTAALVSAMSALTAPSAYSEEPKSPRYNPFENRWEMATPNAQPQYNPFENKWEMAEPGDSPQYNPFENRWEMGTPNAQPKYNPFENKWEMAEPDESPRYNPFENRWEMAD